MKWLRSRRAAITGLILLAVGLTPPFVWGLALLIDRAGGCPPMDEAGVARCVVHNVDVTGPLSVLTLLPFLMVPLVAGLPAGLLLLTARAVARMADGRA